MKNSWIQKGLQVFLLMRLHRPVGIYLLFWPGCWGLLAGAYPKIPSLKVVVLFGLGAMCMRGFGCIINDLWDKDIDGFVWRTQKRPLALAFVSWKWAALGCLILGALSLIILSQFNTTAIWVGLLAVPLILVYPFMKRVTYGAQGFLGITFSWGVPLGWVVENPSPEGKALLCLYSACVLWVIAYDTIYGYQDLKDDALIGLKSTSLWAQENPQRLLSFLYGACMVSLLLFGLLQNRGAIFYGTLLTIGLYFIEQVVHLDIRRPEECLNAFKSAHWAQGVVAGGLFLDVTMNVRVNDLVSYLN